MRWLFEGRRPSRLVVLYTRGGCGLCDDAKELLEKYRQRYRLEIRTVDIDGSPELVEKYGLLIPVIEIDGRERFRGRINESLLRRALRFG